MIANASSDRLRTRESLSSPTQRLTAEGWYYVLVVAFIIGGAVLREVNLLVLLAGLMLGPLLWNWLLVRWALRHIEASEVPLARVHVGEPLRASWLLHNGDAKLAAWSVVLDEGVRQEGQTAYRRARVVTPCLAPKRSVRVGYKLTFPRRGTYELGPVRISTSFPLGLVRSSAWLRYRRSVTVWPALGKLRPAWHALLRQSQLGQRTAQPRKGRLEGDYYGLREWRPGDSRRWIHWRTTARLDELTVKQFEQRRDEALTLVIDLWAPEDASEDRIAAVERVLQFAATVIQDRRRRGDQEVHVVLHGESRESWRGMLKGALAVRILDALAMARPTSRKTNPLDARDFASMPQRNVIVISSRERPGQIGWVGCEVTWIGPSDYERWFEAPPGETAIAADREPVRAKEEPPKEEQDEQPEVVTEAGS
ncbi:MAG TPA: DUF58 domain-containing protein [Planctomycetaceae bacterium]|nr:DUF58 domain-containing protein [Planctomycetaceae bacterium]